MYVFAFNNSDFFFACVSFGFLWLAMQVIAVVDEPVLTIMQSDSSLCMPNATTSEI
jgi:hypothetical protein